MTKTNKEDDSMKKNENLTSNIKKLLTVQDVAQRLNCSQRLIYTMKSYGKMPLPIKIGRLVRWDGDVIENWIIDGCPPVISFAKGIKKFNWKQ